LDTYVLAEQYLEGLVLRDGKLLPNMPAGRQLVHLPAEGRDFVNRSSEAGVVKEAIEALDPYLK
jgi:hypothetical protein